MAVNVEKNLKKDNMRTTRVLVFISALLVGDAEGVSITQFEVPGVALAGDDIHLGCHYQEDVSTGNLYSLKWYKDTREFYRHVPGSTVASGAQRCDVQPPFAVPGVTVDCWASTERHVVLKGVTNTSSGVYICEVIGEHPKFTKQMKNATLRVYSEPLQVPELTQGPEVSDDNRGHESFTCVSRNSEYNPTLSWRLNDNTVNKSWVRQLSDTTSTLEVPVRGEHFLGGVMRVACLASLGKSHNKASMVKLRRQDHLSAQEYQYNTATTPTGARTEGVQVLVLLLTGALALCFLWSHPSL